MLIAHRGLYDNKKIKENTIKAFDKALQNGFDGFETDLRQTKDGKIVLMHDPIISRVSDSFGLVKNMEYSKLKKKFKDITTLEDITNKYQNQIIFLELKDKIKKEQEVKAIKDTIENKASSKIQIAIQNDEKVKEAISALQVLGYNRKEIEKAFGKLPTIEMSTEELIRKGLVALGK